MAGKISPSCKWNGMFPFRSVATKKVEQLRRLSVCSGKFPLEPRVPFAFQPVEPEILAKWKALQAIFMGRLGQKTIQWTNQNQSELWVRGTWQSAGKQDGVRFSPNPKELFLTFNYTLFYIHNCNTTLLTIPRDSSFWLVVLSRSVSIHKENLPTLARLAWTFLASAKGEPVKSFTW